MKRDAMHRDAVERDAGGRDAVSIYRFLGVLGVLAANFGFGLTADG